MSPVKATLLGHLDISLNKWISPNFVRATWWFNVHGIVTVGDIARCIVLDGLVRYGFSPLTGRGGRWWLLVAILPINF